MGGRIRRDLRSHPHHHRHIAAPARAHSRQCRAYIVAAYWFTSSTSFANPAITIVRSLTDSFAGIAPRDVPMFVAAQLAGAVSGAIVGRSLFSNETDRELS